LQSVVLKVARANPTGNAFMKHRVLWYGLLRGRAVESLALQPVGLAAVVQFCGVGMMCGGDIVRRFTIIWIVFDRRCTFLYVLIPHLFFPVRSCY
jgi:hypothetical protein